MLDVLNNFMKKRLIVKSSDCTDLLSLMHTPPEHITKLAYIYATTEQRPLLRLIAQLYQNAVSGTVEGTLIALSIEHLNFLDRVTKTPR